MTLARVSFLRSRAQGRASTACALIMVLFVVLLVVLSLATPLGRAQNAPVSRQRNDAPQADSSAASRDASTSREATTAHEVSGAREPSTTQVASASREPSTSERNVSNTPARESSAREPSAREVVRMALAAARGLGPSRIRELARRARLAGLLPQLRVSGERGLQQDLSSSFSSQSDRRNEALGDDFSAGVSLTFELERLVFAPEEVRLLSVERWLAGDQHKLASDVVRLYFQRRRLLREQSSAATPDPELSDSIAEAEALLDELTNGAFAQALTRARSGPRARTSDSSR